MSTDLYDATSELDPYFIDRTERSPRGRIWAVDKAVITLAAAGIVQIFKGTGSDPTGLTGYSSSKLWLRDVGGGITTAPAEVRVWDGSGSTSLLASWPLLTTAGLDGLRRHLSVYSRAQIDALALGSSPVTSSGINNASSVSGTKVTDALNTLLSSVNAKVSTSLLGANSGVATLDSSGKLSAAQRFTAAMDIAGLPALTVSSPGGIDIAADRIPIYDSSGTLNGYITATDIFKAINSVATDSAPDVTADFVLTYDTSASAPKKVLLNKLAAGKQSIFIPAGAFRAVTTGTKTAALTTTAFDSGTVDLTFPVLTFSATVDNHAWTTLYMPPAWNRQAVTFRVVYMNSAAGTGTVIWELGAMACGTGETFDAALATQTVSDATAVGTASYNITTVESSSLTIAGSPQVNDTIVVQIKRPAATNVSDTFTQTTHLVGVIIYYTTSKSTDD